MEPRNTCLLIRLKLARNQAVDSLWRRDPDVALGAPASVARDHCPLVCWSCTEGTGMSWTC